MLLFSALSYCLAFWAPYYFFWAIFPAFILLFKALQRQSLRFGNGFRWGSIAYGLLIFPMFWSLYQIADTWMVWLGWLFMTGYLALHAGLWFFFMGRFRRVFFGPIIASWLYFWWIDRGVLWIFGNLEGFSLLTPLVPLMYVSQLFYFLPIFGVGGMLFIFLITCYSAVFINEKRGWILFCLCLVLWLTGFFIESYEDVPSWVSKIGIIRTRYEPCKKVYSLDCVQELCKQIAQLREFDLSKSLFITPESAIPCHLNTFSRSLNILCEQAHSLQLLVGAYRYDEYGGHNSCYWLSNGSVSAVYDKKHGIPFVERMPYWCNCAFLRNWFLRDFDDFALGKEVQVFDCRSVLLRPVLCSELFFTDFEIETGIVTAMVNDAWFGESSYPQLLWLLAQLRMRARGLPLIYVSYRYAYFMSSTGRVWDL